MASISKAVSAAMWCMLCYNRLIHAHVRISMTVAVLTVPSWHTSMPICFMRVKQAGTLLQVMHLDLGSFVEVSYADDSGQDHLGVMEVIELFEDTQVP